MTGVVVDPAQSCLLLVGGISEGMEDLTDPTDIQLFPNPASSEITLNIVNQAVEIRDFIITDVSGRVVRTFSTDKSRVENNLSEFAVGVYIIRTILSGSPVRRMFIKN